LATEADAQMTVVAPPGVEPIGVAPAVVSAETAAIAAAS